MTITGLSWLVPASRVIGYVTSAADGEDTDDDESAAVIDAACERYESNLVEVMSDVDEGPTIGRPALRHVLQESPRDSRKVSS